MLKHDSILLRTITILVFIITLTPSCYRGPKGKMVFTGVDGTTVESRFYYLSQNNSWKSKVPTNATGTVELFTTAGKLVGQYAVSNGVLHGRAFAWDTDDGSLVQDATYSHGKLNGNFTRWHSKNLKEVEGVYRNGLPVGRQLVWHENGQLVSDANYANGLLHGHYRTWLPDGAILDDVTLKQIVSVLTPKAQLAMFIARANTQSHCPIITTR